MGLMDRDYMHERWHENENAPPRMPPKLHETVFRENRSMAAPAKTHRNPQIPAFRTAVLLWVLSFTGYIYMASQRALAVPKEFAKYALTPREQLILLSDRFSRWVGSVFLDGSVSASTVFEINHYLQWVVVLSFGMTAIGLMCFQMAARWIFIELSLLFFVFVAIHSTPIVSTSEVVAVIASAVMVGVVISKMYSGVVDLKFRGYAVS